MHLFTERFGDPLSNHTFIEATNKLFDRLAVTPFYTHTIWLRWPISNEMTSHDVPRSPPYNHEIRLGRVVYLIIRDATGRRKRRRGGGRVCAGAKVQIVPPGPPLLMLLPS
jgi:hypothetical protein